jgi:ribonucleoside-triphosphate reductase
VRESIRVTTIKPNGTTVILVSESSGVHFPCFHYAIRRVRIAANSDLVPILHKAGYKSEPDVYSGPGTLVFSFPVDQTGGGKTRTATQVSLWEQACLESSLARIWADNSISQTLYFDPVNEGKIIENVLAQTCPLVKSLSMLPHTPAGVYEQSPYEEITKEQYDVMTKDVKPINWTEFADEPIISRGCDSDVCDIKAYLEMKRSKTE